MRWTSTLSLTPESPRALADVMLAIERDLDGPPDVLILHTTPHHRPLWDRLPSLLADRFPKAALLGVSGGGVLADGTEAEEGPGIAVLAGTLPGVELRTFQIDTRSDDSRGDNFAAALQGVPVDRELAMVLLADPFSTPLRPLLSALEYVFPSATVIGGLASGGEKAGDHLLFTNQGSVSTGAVGLAMWGDIQLDIAVGQGCRPVGPPMIVTKHRDNFIVALDERPPMMVLRELFKSLPERDQLLFRSSLQLGVSEEPHTHHNGEDFVIRDIIGADAETHALAVATPLQQWQVVRFMLRDADASRLSLHQALSEEGARWPADSAEAALVFSGHARGRALFGQPHVDSRQVRAQHEMLPIAGFFGNGEIATGHDQIELHTCSSAVGVLRRRSGGS